MLRSGEESGRSALLPRAGEGQPVLGFRLSVNSRVAQNRGEEDAGRRGGMGVARGRHEVSLRVEGTFVAGRNHARPGVRGRGFHRLHRAVVLAVFTAAGGKRRTGCRKHAGADQQKAEQAGQQDSGNPMHVDSLPGLREQRGQGRNCESGVECRINNLECTRRRLQLIAIERVKSEMAPLKPA